MATVPVAHVSAPAHVKIHAMAASLQGKGHMRLQMRQHLHLGKFWHGFWPGIWAWDFDVGFWRGMLAWDLGMGFWRGILVRDFGVRFWQGILGCDLGV